MGLFDGCLLACDIDGTLVVNDRIAQRCIDKIGYFVSEGGSFALATGRSVGAVGTVLKALPNVIGPSIVGNGTVIYDYCKDALVLDEPFPECDRFLVKEVEAKFPDMGIEVHTGKDVLVIKNNAEIEAHQQYENLISFNVTMQQAYQRKWNKLFFTAENPDDLIVLKEFIESKKIISKILNTTAVIDGRTRHYLEVVPPDISKASKLDTLCEFLNINKGCCFAIGDYYNDVEMLKAADVAAVPVDSPEDVKALADFITGTAENGAVADFIEYLSVRLSSARDCQ